MAKTETTVKGYVYTVTSPNGGTVTDAEGKLNKTVDAGDQVTVTAPSDTLTCDDDAAVICKVNFKGAALVLRLLGGGDNSGLPAGFTPVEYLECYDTATINTGVITSENTGAFAIAMAIGYYDRPIVATNNSSFSVPYKIGSTGTNVIYSWNGKISQDVNSKGDQVTYGYLNWLGSGKVEAKGRFESQTAFTYEMQNELEGAMLTYREIIISQRWRGKIYRVGISEGGNVTHEFMPAVDQTGTPCMYDIVSKQPFYNSGTGDFTYPGKEEESTTYSLRRPRMYAQKTERGIRRLYHVPKGFNGTPEEYAEENGFKVLVETPAPEEGYWAPVWHDREDCIELEWVETEPPAEEF